MRNNSSIICLEAEQPIRARWSAYTLRPHVWIVHQYRKFQMERARGQGMRMADRLVTVGYAGRGNKSVRDNWLAILRNLPPGLSEIYCHPAYPDETLTRWSYYREDRRRELDILSDPELSEESRRAGVEIVSFDAL